MLDPGDGQHIPAYREQSMSASTDVHEEARHHLGGPREIADFLSAPPRGPQRSDRGQPSLVIDMCEPMPFERMTAPELVTHLSDANTACFLAHDRFVRVVVVRPCFSTCSAAFMQWCRNSGIDIRYRRSLRGVLRS